MHDATVNFGSYVLTFNSNYCRKHCRKPKSTVTALCALPPPTEGPIEFNTDNSRADSAIPKPIKVSFIGAGTFAHVLKRHKLRSHALSIHEVNLAINQFHSKEEWRSMVPVEYHELIDLFSEKAVEKLPPHRPYDHTISVVEGKSPPYGPLYGMSRAELEALKKYLEENLNKNFIRHSSSPAGAPVLFVKKADGSL